MFIFLIRRPGGPSGIAGAIFQTTNGGHQWIDRALPCTRTCTKLTDLLRCRFTDPQTGWIAGERGMVYRTTDSGYTWTGTGCDRESLPVRPVVS